MTIISGRTARIVRLGVLALCLGAPKFAAAQETEPKPADATPPAADPDKTTLNFFKGTEIGGLIDTYYLYNSTKTAPLFHAFDTKQNSFDVSMAEVWLAKTPAADSPIGYKIRTTFGNAADIVAGASGQFAAESPYKNIEEAYGSYLAPVGKGLQIDVGKFVTTAGAEVIEAKDDWNYSRSLLFQLAVPFYHTGVRLTYSPNDKVSLIGGVVNGWNTVSDNNTGKSVLASIILKPTGAVSITENYIGGPEQPKDNSDWRTLSDTVVSYTVNPVVSLLANYDYGRDTNSVTGTSVTWQGIAGYAKFQANKYIAVIPRVEYYDDANGFTTGTVQKLTDATVTLEVKPVDSFLWRIEYRGDFSNQSPFMNDANVPKRNQQMIEFGMIFFFSSKS